LNSRPLTNGVASVGRSGGTRPGRINLFIQPFKNAFLSRNLDHNNAIFEKAVKSLQRPIGHLRFCACFSLQNLQFLLAAAQKYFCPQAQGTLAIRHSLSHTS